MDVATFKSNLRGELIVPEDESYEEARKVYNAMVDKRPRFIARCRDAADVVASVNFGRENDLLISIRCGGHSAPGFGVCDDGLVIDLSHINNVHVDPAARTALAGGGSTWADLDHATHAFGLAVPGGIISTTGVAGLSLGGGIGYLTRACGLSIDSFLECTVVLADGSCVTASEKQNEDLFWGLRGGGGNFGVVTSILFKAHAISTVYGGPMIWELEHARKLMTWYRDFIPGAPEDVNCFFTFLVVPPGPPFPENFHGKNMCGLVWCYTGPEDKIDQVFGPVRNDFNPAIDLVGPIPHPSLQSMFDPIYPPGLNWYWKGDFLNEISDDAIELFIKHGSQTPTPLSTVHLYPINGKAHCVGGNDSAWSYRDAVWAEIIAGADPDPSEKDKIVDWTQKFWSDIHPHSAGGSYVNFLQEEGQDRIAASYRNNYKRLSVVKRKYDPSNLFRVNQNILPAEDGQN
jgi:FAD/FMN-containing dehydrogenase